MEKTHDNLVAKLESLSENFSNLGIRLSLAAKELQNTGTPFSESLLEEVMAYNKNFTEIKEQGLKLAETFQISTGAIFSVTDLENLIKAVKQNTESSDSFPQKSTTANLPPLIVVPSGGGETSNTPINDPDIIILEETTPAKAQEEIIIVPGVETPQNSPQIQRPNVMFGESTNKPSEVSVGLKIIAHIQNLGDRSFVAGEYAGTKGQGFRVEAFQINIEPPVAGLNVEYMANIGGIGETPWLEAGKLAGERGKARRLEGFAIRLTGSQAGSYDIFYTAHVQNMGDSPVYTNGQYCGTRNKSLRVEGIKVWIEPKS